MITCLGCGYDLRSLPKGKCPECGRQFDPQDKATFRGPPVPINPRHVRWLIGAAITWPLGMVLLTHAAAISARLEMGRWPVPSLDSPSGFGPPTSYLVNAALWSVVLSPYLLVCILLFFILPAVSRWEKRSFATAMRVLFIPLVGWFMLWGFLYFAQSWIVEWMID